MGKQDTKAKEYLQDNRRFADVVNYFLYDGKPVVKAEQLLEQDTTEVITIQELDAKEDYVQKWRDLLKKMVVKTDNSVSYVLIGIENQTEIHYATPVKNMLYDAINYGSQVKQIARENKKSGNYADGSEFLSGIKKTDKLIPVVTIVVYLGTRDWDAPRSLHEMLEYRDASILRFVPDYKVNLIIPKEVEDFDKFSTEVRYLFKVLGMADKQEAWSKVFATDRAYREMDNETVSAINLFAGAAFPLNKKKGVTDMCKAWDDMKSENFKQGLEQGLEQAAIEMIRENDSDEKIHRITKLPLSRIAELREKEMCFV